ncbi:MAG TPA: endonuclease MutS2 [Candidatus Polarisedimenticolia bacterium]|nr:endonuclease MutS2 [Candidatus Polarisedimenticolia bacterium]
MSEDVLSALEFDRVLELLATETSTPPGAALSRGLSPTFDPAEVERENRLLAEALRYFEIRGALPFGVVPDPSPTLIRLEVEGAVLAPLEVLDLVLVMKAGRTLKSSLTESRREFPGMWGCARDLPDLGNLIRFLDGKIATTGELEDTASDELHGVRQEIRRRNERLKEALDAIVGRPDVARALQDTFVSIRSDRHVIPIRAEAQGSLQGIVHGVSGSGATVFVEPIETVDLNNQIVTLRDREAAEIQRLLQEYSDLLRGRLAELRHLVAGIGRLDLLSARGRLGRRLDGRPGEISKHGELRLEAARHPLVELTLQHEGSAVTPLDLDLAADSRVLMISGPNTGGKTVALKTAGLLSLMFQSGLPVPARRAVLPVFRGIFIDIGDRQSIPDRLSTFSARMKNISEIATSVKGPALVLLDEVGTGTDPEDGVALAIAIVDFLRAKGALIIATTHLEALKAYAATTAGCINAAMQFDETTFTPTYRLIPGIPGRSGGLEIARRLGLPAAILDAARARRGQPGEQIASYLARLQTMSEELQARLREARAEKERFERERAALQARFQEREARGQKAVAAEVEHALKAMREEGEVYIQGLKDRELALALRRRESKAAAALRAKARTLLKEARSTDTSGGGTTVGPGASVFIEGMGVRGVVESVRGDRAVVQVRGKRMTVALHDCRPERDKTPPAERSPRLPDGVTLSRKPADDARDEIHLLGRTIPEALEIVDKYLDDVYLAGLSPVRLIHGVGTGRLKKAIADHLARHPHVEEFAAAPAEKGGAGVTIVTLRL